MVILEKNTAGCGRIGEEYSIKSRFLLQLVPIWTLFSPKGTQPVPNSTRQVTKKYTTILQKPHSEESKKLLQILHSECSVSVILDSNFYTSVDLFLHRKVSKMLVNTGFFVFLNKKKENMLYYKIKTEQTSGRCVDIGENLFYFSKNKLFSVPLSYTGIFFL